jgi:hypothetical protein
MGAKERDIINNRLVNLKPSERLFRINAGVGWVGQTVKHTPNMIILKNPRPLISAPEGWGDLVGWTEIEITSDMVGKKIAVFTMEEAKTGKLKLSEMQKMFRDIILRMGGIFRELR